ncbi:MAG TPA: class I SAM-dependent methyltransferase [Caldisericia bacterium]|nr:class I SAM-dependent methyltransferase [Caldisericia bacterium]HPF48895.1 class I SAM-dependent methyltransferase [Caldisericia bacterium]HPI83241.1 class I SAM-dependent methyltransferase [Caldisericia bacterium]HPQ92468.1 class I SAM-dependent methyltransferase [Caldisericia bacterium]HRV74434.1 class I SAM-dependent methyltransferase [Caldisericia bacterium]
MAKWWETFFASFILEIQFTPAPKELVQKRVSFIENVLGLAPGNKVLDVPCGDGYLTIELAKKGYSMTGVDLTQAVIDYATVRSKQKQLHMDLYRMDMRDLPWKSRFDGAFCFGGSFGFFDDKGNTDFLKSLHKCLKPQAKIIIDTHVSETLLPVFKKENREQIGDLTLIQKRQFDHEHGVINSDWTVIKDGIDEHYFASMRIYSYKELKEMLQHIGFENIKGYGSLDGKKFGLGDERLYLEASKA